MKRDFQICISVPLNESLLKMMKNAIYFILKDIFALEIFKVLY